MPMDLQSIASDSSTSSLDGIFQQILYSMQDALDSQVRTTLDHPYTESTEEMLSDFDNYLLQVEVARSASGNPLTNAGLVFDQSNLLSVHDLLKRFWDLDHSSLNSDYRELMPQFAIYRFQIEGILASSASEPTETDHDGAASENASRPPSPTSHWHVDLAEVGSWLQNPGDTSQDESDTADDDEQVHDTSYGIHLASLINSHGDLDSNYVLADSSYDVNEASSLAVQFSEMTMRQNHSTSSSREDD